MNSIRAAVFGLSFMTLTIGFQNCGQSGDIGLKSQTVFKATTIDPANQNGTVPDGTLEVVPAAGEDDHNHTGTTTGTGGSTASGGTATAGGGTITSGGTTVVGGGSSSGSTHSGGASGSAGGSIGGGKKVCVHMEDEDEDHEEHNDGKKSDHKLGQLTRMDRGEHGGRVRDEVEDDDKDECEEEHIDSNRCSQIKVSDVSLSIKSIQAEGVELNLVDSDKTFSINKRTLQVTSNSDITISKINIILEVKGNRILDVNGSTFDLKTPSAQTSGLKINLTSSVNLKANQVYTLELDIDPSQQLVSNSQKCLLKPTVKKACIKH